MNGPVYSLSKWDLHGGCHYQNRTCVDNGTKGYKGLYHYFPMNSNSRTVMEVPPTTPRMTVTTMATVWKPWYQTQRPNPMKLHIVPRRKQLSMRVRAMNHGHRMPNFQRISFSLSSCRYSTCIMSFIRSFLGSEPSPVAARIRACVVRSERMKRQTTAHVVAPRLKMMLMQRKTRGSTAGSLPSVCRRVVSTPLDNAVCRQARGRMSHCCGRRVERAMNIQ